MNFINRFILGLVVAGPQLLNAVPQVVTGPGITILDNDGHADGVSLQNQAADASTLFVPLNLTVNENEHAVGIATDNFATGTIVFDGHSAVNGSTGIASGNPLGAIELGLEDVTFNGDVSAQTFRLRSHLLTINGNLILPVDATLYTKILTNDVFGNINLNGSTSNTINAATVNIVVDASDALALNNGQVFNVVFASMGTSGIPISISNNNVRYSFTSNGSNNGIVAITSNQVPIPTLVKNPNAQSVGAVLDDTLSIAGAFPDSDFAHIQTKLGSPTAAILQDALLQISAAPGLVGVSRESFNIARQFQRIILEHLQYPHNHCEGDNQIKLWGDVYYYYGHQNNRKYFNGYNANTWGTMLALEVPFTSQLRSGVGFGYAYGDINARDFRCNTTIHSYEGMGYIGYQGCDWFLDGGLSIGWNRYNGQRHIHYRDVNRTARAEYNGQQYTSYLVTGYEYQCGEWEVNPMGSLIYSYLHLCKYKERDANSLNLYVKSQDYQFWQTALGVKATRHYDTCFGTFIPEIHTFWLHDCDPCTLDAKASFIGLGAAGGNFLNRGPRFDQNTWNIGASLRVFATPDLSLLGLYDYEVNGHYYSHQGMLEFEWTF